MARSSYTTVIPTTGGNVIICTASETRIGLIIGSPTSGNSFLSTEPNVTSLHGIMHTGTGPPIALSYLVHGDCVQRAWYANTSAAGQFITVIECFDDDYDKTVSDYLRGFQA